MVVDTGRGSEIHCSLHALAEFNRAVSIRLLPVGRHHHCARGSRCPLLAQSGPTPSALRCPLMTHSVHYEQRPYFSGLNPTWLGLCVKSIVASWRLLWRPCHSCPRICIGLQITNAAGAVTTQLRRRTGLMSPSGTSATLTRPGSMSSSVPLFDINPSPSVVAE